MFWANFVPFFRQLKAISKPPGTRGFEVGFRVLPVFKKSGRGRSRVGKKPARKPVFTVFGYPGISLDLFTLALSILLYFAGRSRRDTIWQLLGNIAQKSLLSRGGASSYFSPPLVYGRLEYGFS